MDNTLIINTIRICIKANKFSFGETMIYDIRSNKAKVVIIATDAGKANSKKVTDKCKYFEVPYYELFTKSELISIFNKNLSSFCITDDNLAKKFIMNLNKGGNDYGNR